MGLSEKAAEILLDTAIKQGWFERLRAIGKKRKNILVLGATGSGKSNLINSLSTEVPEVIHYLNRTEYAKKKRLSIDRNPLTIIDTPGQRHHDQRRNRAIRETISKGISAIINVVSYGYHENKLGEKHAFLDGNIVDPKYLEEHRKLEIDLLQEWNSIIGLPETGKSLITVISKADLWWDQEEKIYEHYISGDYYKGLGLAQQLNPSTIHYSSILQKFYGKGALSGSFDGEDMRISKINLISTIISSIENG